MEASATELDEFLDKDFFGIIINDNLPWAWISKMSMIWDKCNRHRVPVYLHTGPFEEPLIQWNWDYNNERFRKQLAHWPAPQFNRISQRWQAGVASLITEGILDQWPDLRIVICEHGISWMRDMRDFMLSQSWPDPLPYFQKNFWITCEPEEKDFIDNARWVGWDRLLFATDYPHNDRGGDCRLTDVETVTQMLENNLLTQQEFDLFTHLNYLRLKHRT
jgi:predicted TIM-barrel fold metal-dependent hydrolase